MFSLLTMLDARIAYRHTSTYIYIHKQLNILSYNSACIYITITVDIVHSTYSQSVSEPACGAGSWTTTLGGTVVTINLLNNFIPLGEFGILMKELIILLSNTLITLYQLT